MVIFGQSNYIVNRGIIKNLDGTVQVRLGVPQNKESDDRQRHENRLDKARVVDQNVDVFRHEHHHRYHALTINK